MANEDAGFPKGPLTDEEHERIREMFSQGSTPTEIADELRRSLTAVRKSIQLAGAALAIQAKDYNARERLRLADITFQKYEFLLQTCNDGFQFRALVESFKTLCEVKVREETGGKSPDEQHQSFTLNLNVVSKPNSHYNETIPDTVEGEVTSSSPEQQNVAYVEPEYDPLNDV